VALEVEVEVVGLALLGRTVELEAGDRGGIAGQRRGGTAA